MSEPKTADQIAQQIAEDAEQRLRADGHDVVDVDWAMVRDAALDGITEAVALHVDRDQIRAAISNSYYAARDQGGTMETAADLAADAVISYLTLGRLG